ncbi:MAG: carbohydrate-binding family 9-like protein [Pseudomonadota bacterium]
MLNKKHEYVVHYADPLPDNKGDWNGPVWEKIPHLELTCFRPEGSGHRPTTKAKLIYDSKSLYCIFQVQDQYVSCVHSSFQSPVCQDSCVEFFVQPKPDCGYFNFEFNCGGTLLASYVTDPTRVGTGLKKYSDLTLNDIEPIDIFHSLPQRVSPEIQQKITWYLAFSIPFALFEKYTGPLPRIHGSQWKANFYKCGDRTSHPHWVSWSPVKELNFHQPDCFGNIYFKP